MRHSKRKFFEMRKRRARDEWCHWFESLSVSYFFFCFYAILINQHCETKKLCESFHQHIQIYFYFQRAIWIVRNPLLFSCVKQNNQLLLSLLFKEKKLAFSFFANVVVCWRFELLTNGTFKGFFSLTFGEFFCKPRKTKWKVNKNKVVKSSSILKIRAKSLNFKVHRCFSKSCLSSKSKKLFFKTHFFAPYQLSLSIINTLCCAQRDLLRHLFSICCSILVVLLLISFKVLRKKIEFESQNCCESFPSLRFCLSAREKGKINKCYTTPSTHENKSSVMQKLHMCNEKLHLLRFCETSIAALFLHLWWWKFCF